MTTETWMKASGQRPHEHARTVVVADDDRDDFAMIAEAWAEVDATVEVARAVDGQALIDLLLQMITADDTYPALVLLDLNMPGVDGWEALSTIKAHEELRAVPIVVFTTASASEFVCRSYHMQAAGFITKPASYQRLVSLISALSTYWFDTTRRLDGRTHGWPG